MLSLKFNSIRLFMLAFGLFLSTSPQTYAWWWSSGNKAVQISVDTPTETYEVGNQVELKGSIREVRKITGQLKNLKSSDLSKLDIEFMYPDRTTLVTDQVSQTGKLDFNFLTPVIDANSVNTFYVVVGKTSPRTKWLRRIQGKLEARIYRINQVIVDLTAQGNRENIITYLTQVSGIYQRIVDKIQEKLSMQLDTLAEIHIPIQVEGRVSAPSYSMNIMSGFMQSVEFSSAYHLTGEKAKIKAKMTNVSNRVSGHNWGWGGSHSKWLVDFKWMGNTVYSVGPKKLTEGETIEHEFESDSLNPGSFPFSVRVRKKSFGHLKPLFAKLEHSIGVIADDVAPVWEVRSPQSEGSYQALSQVDATLTDLLGRINPDRLEVRLSGTLDNGGTFDQSVLTGLSVQLNPAGNGESATITGDLNPIEPGEYTLSFSGEDRAGLFDDASLTFRVDREAPLLQLSGLEPGVIGNQAVQSLSVTVVDASEVQTQIQINGNEVFSSNDSSFVADLSFPNGINTVTLIATDAAGNSTTEEISPIVVDTIAPILTQVIPADGSIANTLGIAVSGSSNEPLQAVSINGVAAQISPDQLSFNGSTSGIAEGSFDIEIVAVDLAGNATQVNSTVEIVLRVLNGHLVSVVPNPEGENLLVVGAPYAARAGSQIEVDGGFFNSASTVASADGSFQTEIGFFQTATVTATDSNLGQSDSVEISYNISTILSGLVRDTDDRPLPGATVSIAGTEISTTTDGTGTFVLSEPVTGDQVLTIDASTAQDPCTDCSPRTFSVSNIPISIGFRQTNTFERPFYIAPYVLDGNETQINESSESVVTHPDVPGVSLRIDAGTATFPGGSHSGAITLGEVSSERTLIPPVEYASPDSVYCLEPSGVQFSEPAELTVPNVNHLPPGTDLVVFSMDTTKGTWEIDGVAEVTDDGQSVRTKDGMGITHLSLIYMSPIAMQVGERGSQDQPGANTFDGALTTQIQMPSYKSLGSDISPQLMYRSHWAAPQVLMSNIVSINRSEVAINRSGGGSGLLGFISVDQNVTGTSFFEPREVTAEFSTTGLHSERLHFNGVPNNSVISFNFGLEHLDSGIAPYLAHYEYQLDRITVGTRRTEESHFFGIFKIRSTEPFREVTEIDKVFPQDLGGPLYVQNKIDSSAGRGWKVVGPQKIVNPNGNRIMIEESDGSVSSYAVDNKIDTVFGEPTGARLDLGVSLNGWPNIHYINRTTDIQYTDLIGNRLVPVNRLTRVDGSSQEDTREEVRIVDTHRAVIAGWHFTNLGTDSFLYDASVTEDPSQMIELNPGRIIIASNRTSRLIMIDCTSGSCNIVPLAGRVSGVRTLSTSAADSIFVRRDIEDYCRGLGATCTLARYVQHFAPNSIGNLPIHNFADGFHGESYLNRPLGITTGLEPNTIIVADTGNHRIRKVNILTRETTTIAGNGQTIDSGDGGMAIDAGIYHPRGVAYDNLGNLYISSENGLIRRIDTTGRISTFAGKNPADSDAIFADLAPKDRASFNMPTGMVFDSVDQALYVADTGHHRIVKIDLNTEEAVNVAGNGAAAFYGDGGPALNASLSAPWALHLDPDRNLLIHDRGNRRVRRVIFQNSSDSSVLFLATAEDHSQIERHPDGTFTRRLRGGEEFVFDTQGQETARTDRVGRTTQFGYDSDGKLLTRTETTGQTTTYQYSGDLLSSITDPANRTTTFSYSGNELDTVTFPDGTSRSYRYDDSGRMIEETNPRGASVQYSYNQFGRLHEVIRPDSTRMTINDSGSATAANNYTGGSMGDLFSSGTDDGQAFEGMIDARGNEVRISKTEEGFIREIVDARGRTTTLEVNSRGQPTRIVRPDSTEVINEYNDLGDLVRTEDTASGLVTTRTVDESTGDLLSETLTQSNGNTATVTQSYLGNTGLVSSRSHSAIGVISTTQYLAGQHYLVDSSTNARGDTTRYEYDSSGNTIRRILPDSSSSQIERDLAGNQTRVVNPNGEATVFTYDEFNRLLSVNSPQNELTQYQYDENGNLVLITDPQSNTTAFDYNNLDQLMTKTSPLGLQTQLTYDENGNLSTQVDPNGNLSRFFYNESNQVVRKELPDNVYEFEYDQRDNVTLAQNDTSLIQFQFTNDREVPDQVSIQGRGSSNDFPAVTLGFTYNSIDQIESMTDPTGTTQYQYDNSDRLTSLTNSYGEAFQWTYDSDNRITSFSRPGSRTDLTYDSTNFLTGMNHLRTSDSQVISFFNYGSRDNAGRRLSMETALGTHSYTYDGNGQLVSASNPDLTGTSAQNETFTYDAIGNRLTDSSGSYVYGVDSNSNSGRDLSDYRGRRLLEDYRYFYFYDSNGNLTSRQEKGISGEVTNLAYTSENQLRSIQVYPSASNPNPSREVFYTYDALGRRMQKEVIDHVVSANSRTRRFVYNGDEMLLEYDESNQLLARYTQSTLRTDDTLSMRVTSDGVAAGIAPSSESYFFLKDGLGSIREIANSTGTRIQSYHYSVYGQLMAIRDGSGSDVTSSPVVQNRYTFTNREFDTESGFYYYRARYYDPSTGRFLQEDPELGRLSVPASVVSRFAYVLNNPISFTDPSGRIIPFLLAGLGKLVAANYISAALVGITSGIFNLNGAEGSDGDKVLSFILGVATFGAATLAIAAYAIPLFAAGTIGGIAAGIGATIGIGFTAGFLNNAGNQAIFGLPFSLKRAAYAGISSAGFTLIGLALGSIIKGGYRQFLVDEGGAAAGGACVDAGSTPQRENEIKFGLCPTIGI